MRLITLAFVGVAACKGADRGPVHDGVSRVAVTTTRYNEGYYLKVEYTARVQKAPGPYGKGVAILAACQIGAERTIVAGPGMGELEAGKAVDLEDNVGITSPWPAQPSLCDLEFHAGQLDGELLGRVCWTDGKIEEKPCPPNVISHAGVGPTGVSAVVTKVTPEAAEGGWPEHLTIEYRATAHKDMPKGAYLVRQTSCPGHRPDDTWHSELQYLRAGESMTAAQNTYKLGKPSPSTPCETLLGFSPEVHGEVTEIQTYCHKGIEITPCRR